MVFSKEWDQVFKQRSHMSIWPWSDVVSFVMRYVKPSGNMDQYKVLELGCGPGANISFFSTLGVDYYAVEGSREIVKNLWEQYPSLKDKIVVADFTEEIPFDCAFDLVIDRGSMTHNTTKSIENGLDLIYGRLKKNGLYMGFDWFSTLHSDFRNG